MDERVSMDSWTRDIHTAADDEYIDSICDDYMNLIQLPNESVIRHVGMHNGRTATVVWTVTQFSKFKKLTYLFFKPMLLKCPYFAIIIRPYVEAKHTVHKNKFFVSKWLFSTTIRSRMVSRNWRH